MKQILFAIFIFPIVLQAQDITLDTSYILKTNNTYYNVRKTVYSDGSGSEVTTFIGDTTALLTKYQSAFVQKSDQMAADIAQVTKYPGHIKQMLNDDNEVTLITGESPQRAVQNVYQEPFLQDAWTFTGHTILFTLNAQGALRYAVDGGATKAAYLFGSTIRLNNYPTTGESIDLYLISTGLYTTADKKIRLKYTKPGGATKRAASLLKKSKQ